MKKYLIISILTFVFLFTSFSIHQKRVCAEVPSVLYAALDLLVHVSVGALIYLESQSGGASEAHKVLSTDFITGEIVMEFVNDVKTGSTSGTSAYPVDDVLESNLLTVYPDYNSKGTTGIAGCNFSDAQMEASWESSINVLDANHTGSHIEYFKLDLGFWAAGNCHQWGASAIMMNDSSLSEGTYDPAGGSLGGSYTVSLDGSTVDLFEFAEDVIQVPTCFDGLQNQDELGIDCGGICLTNEGFDCSAWEKCFNGIQDQDETGIDCGGYCFNTLGFSCAPGVGTPTCSDGVMNQDETGIDYGGVCGTGDPVSTPSTTFTDANGDGVDDISGLSSTGSIPAPAPTGATDQTFDTSLPGDISEVGDTNWTGLITGYLASNPLINLAAGNSIQLSGSSCTLTANVFGSDVIFDFCSVEGLIDLIGTFVLGLMAIRSVFIALGV